MIELTSAEKDKFFASVHQGDPDECWPWAEPPTIYGYGRFYRSKKQVRLQGGLHSLRAHRVAYCLAHDLSLDGLPDGQVVRHDCDNKLCCNPRHLRLGTPQENTQDREDRGRTARGKDTGRAKLTEVQVIVIRSRLQAGEPERKLAKEYNVSRSAINHIGGKRSWRWVTP